MSGTRKARLVDLRTIALVDTVDLPKNQQEVLIRPDGKVAYLSCDTSKNVAAIDLKTFKVEKLNDAGKGADGLVLGGTTVSRQSRSTSFSFSETLKHRSLRPAQGPSPNPNRIVESLLMDAPLRPYDLPRSQRIASCIQRAQ